MIDLIDTIFEQMMTGTGQAGNGGVYFIPFRLC